jgi:hypothetical protein
MSSYAWRATPDHSNECERDEGRDGYCYRYQHCADDCGEEAAGAEPAGHTQAECYVRAQVER